MKRARSLVATAAIVLLSTGCAAASQLTGVAPVAPAAAPPSDAGQQLAALRIAERGSMSGYDRDKFPHWDDQGRGCNTREVVLKRDGKDVVSGSDCVPTSGRWTSAYDGASWTKASAIDIDHTVPLAAAWTSGASTWTTEKRRQFANDLVRPQLLAVTDKVNQQKGEKSPDQWKPPLVSYWCTYAKRWVEVKRYYDLTVTQGEKTALSDMLMRCR